MSALICSKCETEIRPGDDVVFPGIDNPEEQRIIVDGVIQHVTCPACGHVE